MQFTVAFNFPLPDGRSVPLGVTFDLDVSELMSTVDVLEKRLDDPSPYLNTVAGLLRNVLREDFARGGRPEWKALAPSTVARKSAMGLPARTKSGGIPKRLVQRGMFGPQSILIMTGALRDSYVQKGTAGHIESIDKDAVSVEVGSDFKTRDGKPLALFHQEGTRPHSIRNAFGRGKTIQHPGMPARPVTVTDEDADAIAKALADYLVGDS